MDNKLGVVNNTLAIGTFRNTDVDGIVDVLQEDPIIKQSDWDHIVEGSISVPSGRLVVFGCTGVQPDAARIYLEPGQYEILT